MYSEIKEFNRHVVKTIFVGGHLDFWQKSNEHMRGRNVPHVLYQKSYAQMNGHSPCVKTLNAYRKIICNSDLSVYGLLLFPDQS